jgi:hypothetical protein
MMKLFEKYAISKYPVKGPCPNPCMAGGYHRVGRIPVLSLMDGASPGDVCREYCLECGQEIWHTDRETGEKYQVGGFVLRNQPSAFGIAAKTT